MMDRESERVADLIHADLMALLQSARRMHEQTKSGKWGSVAAKLDNAMKAVSPLLDQSSRDLIK